MIISLTNLCEVMHHFESLEKKLHYLLNFLFVIIKNGLWDATTLVQISFCLIFSALAIYEYQDSNGMVHYLKSL